MKFTSYASTEVGWTWCPPASTDSQLHGLLVGLWEAWMGMGRVIDVDSLPTDDDEEEA